MPATSTPLPSPQRLLHRRMRVERVAMLGEGCRMAGYAGIAGVLVMAASLFGLGSGMRVVAWALVMLPVILSNLVFDVWMRAPALGAEAAERLERLYVVRSALAGIGWGCVVFLMPNTMQILPAALVCLIMLVVALGGAGAMAASRAAYYAFVVPMLAPIAGLFLLRYSDEMPAIGWGVISFLLLLLGLHEMLGRALVSALRRRVESEALVQEQQVIFDTAAEAIVFAKGARIVKCNRRFLTLMDATEDEVVGSPMWVWHAESSDWSVHGEAAHSGGERAESYTYVAPLRRRNGEVFWAELTGTPVDPEHAEAGTVWMGSDITGRLATEAALRTSEERFRRLVSMSSDLYWEQDAEQRFTRLSGAGLAFLGERLSQVVGKKPWEIPGLEGVAPEQWQRNRAQVEAREPFRDLVFQVRSDEGDMRWFSSSGNPIFDEQQRFVGYHGIATDITDRIRSAERYRHLAYHDSLTGLPNRRLLADRIEQAIAQSRRRGNLVALMQLDLDAFKAINDTDGHAIGDAVLATIAHRMRTTVRELDTVARVGGDEFVILLPEVESVDAAQTIAGKVIAAVREPVESDDRSYRLGVSIGIAFFPGDGDNADRLMQRADAAMYRAKASGGQRSHLASELLA